MIRVIERNEALGMLCRLKDTRRILDAHALIKRRMKHEQCTAKTGNRRLHVWGGKILEKAFADDKIPAGQAHSGLAMIAYLFDAITEEVGDMLWRIRGADSDDAAHRWKAVRSLQHGSSAQRMSDQE